jgi:hypothetical protein
VFLASNNPQDVEKRASNWLSLPILRELPSALLAFASSPSVLATTFFALGALSGWAVSRWWANRDRLKWWQVLATDLSWMATRIDASSWSSDVHTLNADLNVLRLKVAKRGLDFPKYGDGFKTLQSLLPYLRQVSALLEANELVQARAAARELSKPSIGIT